MLDIANPNTWVILMVVALFFVGLYLVFRKIFPEISWRISILKDEDKYR